MTLDKEGWEKKTKSLIDKNSRLEKQVQEPSRRCNMQKKILDMGNYSALQSLLDQFMAYAKVQLKHIIVAMRHSEFDPDTPVAICQFREFLLSIHTQLGQYADLPDKVLRSEMGRVREKYTEIGKSLEFLRALSEDEIDGLIDAEERLDEYILQLVEEKHQP